MKNLLALILILSSYAMAENLHNSNPANEEMSAEDQRAALQFEAKMVELIKNSDFRITTEKGLFSDVASGALTGLKASCMMIPSVLTAEQVSGMPESFAGNSLGIYVKYESEQYELSFALNGLPQAPTATKSLNLKNEKNVILMVVGGHGFGSFMADTNGGCSIEYKKAKEGTVSGQLTCKNLKLGGMFAGGEEQTIVELSGAFTNCPLITVPKNLEHLMNDKTSNL